MLISHEFEVRSGRGLEAWMCLHLQTFGFLYNLKTSLVVVAAAAASSSYILPVVWTECVLSHPLENTQTEVYGCGHNTSGLAPLEWRASVSAWCLSAAWCPRGSALSVHVPVPAALRAFGATVWKLH